VFLLLLILRWRTAGGRTAAVEHQIGPVKLPDSAEQKYSTAFAGSSGVLYEPVGMPAQIAAPIAAGPAGFRCASSERIMRVSTGPGQTAFTRTPNRVASAAAAGA
jgi:hypothetical protein